MIYTVHSYIIQITSLGLFLLVLVLRIYRHKRFPSWSAHVPYIILSGYLLLLSIPALECLFQ